MKDRKPARARTRMDFASISEKTDAKLGRDVQAKIGQQLRAIYEDVLSQGVPDRFSELLRQLDEPSGAKPDVDKDRQ